MTCQKTLKLYVYVDGGINDTPFPNAEDHIEIGAFRYNAQRMGAAPTITATILFGSCLDKVWTNQVYVEFNGEKYYLKQTPTSSFDNEDCRYKHNAEFVSERVILDNVYFYDAVKPGQSNVDDKPKSNSTKFSFWGDVNEFAKRLSASLLYSGLDYSVIVDDDVESEEKMVEFEDAFFSNAIQEIYNVYKIPYYFVGKVIHIGYTNSELPHPLQYGVDNQLISITKNNKNNKVVNRITGKGSTENIPFYYPNNSPKGDISAKVTSSSPSATATIVDYDKFSSEIKLDGVITRVNASYSNVKASHLDTTFSSGSKAWNANVGSGGVSKMFSIEFDSSDVGSIKLDFVSRVTKYKLNDTEIKDATISIRYSVRIRKDKNKLLASQTNLSSIQDIELPVDGAGKYSILINVSYVPTGKYSGKGGQIVYDASYNLGAATGWMYDYKPVDLSKIGLEVSGDFSNGDTITQVLEKYVNTSDTLLPSIYRETDGAERFYNALNNTHLLKDGDGYYSFKNEYVDGMPKEHIVSFEDIKPTIKGSVNQDVSWAEGGKIVFQRLDMFADFAYDKPDSDETYEDSEDNSNVKYKHGYFFAKLRKLPFNLFDHAIEDQPMTISFTNGSCGACKFKIGVTEEYPHKNPVQVDANGNLVRDEQGRVVCGVHGAVKEFQDSQQDTSKGEVWIALMKEEETYGVLMPKAPVYSNSTLVESGFRPKACSNGKSNDGDEFVILGIHLPKSYILEAEEKLKHELLKYMQENNEEKFSFNIKFSRIYFEENPDILDYLNENSAVTVIYDGGEYSLFVKSFSYSMSEGDILPDISVELDENLSVGQNAIQNAISAVQSEVGNAVQAVQATISMQKRMFVQKQTDDTAIGEITFTKGIKLGNGGKVEITEDSAKLYIDYLEVRKKATFTSLEIQEKTHVGGQMIISPASMTCKRVEEIQGSNGDVLSYRCYMQTEGEGGEEVANQFIVGDQAICQTFNSLGCKYYWRLVTAIGKDYIELSATDCDADSGIPSENDKIIQLGHRTNPERQAAQVLSAYGDNAPAFIMYNGINSFSLTGKEVTGMLWNPSKKEPQMFSYGDFFFGDGSTDDEENLTGQFITYQKKKGDTKKKLHINADVTLGEDSTGLSNLSEWKLQDEKVAQAANDASEAKRIAKESAKKIEDIIADGTISDLEKQALQNELAMIEGDHAEISNNYNIYLDEFENLILDGLDGFVTSDEEEFTSTRSDVKWNIYESSYNAYKKDLEDNIAVEDGIPVGNLSQSQANYYTNRIALLEEISQKINANDEYTQESALKAREEVTDFEYLKGAFGDAKSMAIQGVIMSQMVAVADVEEGENITKADVKAFLNGSEFADDELHGKLILAGGIPEATSEDVEDLEVRAKEASTRIYEDGHIETNDIKAVGGEFNDVKINGSIGSPFVLWRKFDITDSSSGKVYHRYPAGDSNNRYAWIHYNSNGSTLLRYTKVETPNDGSALYSSSTGSQVAVAINCTPINVFDGNASIKTKHDNIVLPKTRASSSSSESDVSGYEINAKDFSWGVENSGRIIRLNNYKWGSTIAYGRTIIKAPSGKYFYENGRQHSQLMISRECVELLGYGTSSVFYGWIVLSRQNVLTVGYYGMPLNVLFQGIFISQAPYLERLWSAELMTTGITETWNIKVLSTNGKYRIYLPMYFSSMSSFHVMLTSQVTTLSGGAISGAPGDNVFACICGKGNEVVNGKTLTYFDVAVGDDDTLNPGGFLFQVISTADWVSPTAEAEAVSAIDDDLGDVPVKSGNYEIYNPGVIVNVIPNE